MVAKDKTSGLEYVGWKFWFVVFVVVAVPAVYASFQLVTERTTPLVPVAMGAIGAALLGSLADYAGIDFVYQVCAFLPLLGLLTIFLPDIRHTGKA